MVRMRVRNVACIVAVCCCMISLCYVTPIPAVAAEGSFTGSWTASGTQERLSFRELGEAAIVKLSGHVNLKDALGNQKDYWSTCIGFADSKKGSDFRCVWRSLSGQEIYIDLQSKKLDKESLVSGEIIGGTGTVENIKGSLTLQWSTLSFQTSKGITEVGGYAKDLKGSFQLP